VGRSTPEDVRELSSTHPWRPGRASAHEDADAFKGSPIHRIVPGLCLQGGDFVCRDGSGGESIYGASFAAEGFVTTHTEPGLLCMANAGPDTNRSKFYIDIL